MEQTKKRNGFVGGLGFIMAAAGSAVGLGNLWSFPYKTSENGGAAFVFVYIFSVIVLGSIVMIAEIYLGKRAQANAVTAYKKAHPNLGWLGLFSLIVPFLIAGCYAVLGGYTVKFTLNSFGDNASVLGTFSGNVGEVILYSAIFLILAIIIVMAGVQNGIEKASKILMPILFLILVAVVIYCLCLGEGVKEGVNYYLNPDFTALGFRGALAAMGQAFFSLSLGMGIMISYGSYTGENVNVGKSAIMIAFFDTLVALLGGLAIFPAIYHYQAVSGIALQDNGIVLMFSSLPIVFDTLGVAGKIVSFLFFGMVTIAAITSLISLLEVITQFFIQRFSIRRKRAILFIGAAVFALSIPIGISLGKFLTSEGEMNIAGFNWLVFFDQVGNTVLMPVCAVGSCVALGWFAFRSKNVKDNFNSNYLAKQLDEEGLKLGWFGKVFSFMVKYVTPVLIAVIEVVGVIEIIYPSVDGVRTYSTGGLVVVLTAGGLLAVALAVYFIFLRKRDTGCNDSELKDDGE